jgi:hypothetical protein
MAAETRASQIVAEARIGELGSDLWALVTRSLAAAVVSWLSLCIAALFLILP